MHAIVGVALGAVYLVMPSAWGDLVGWPAAQPFDHRAIGAAFLAFGFSSYLASKTSSWSEVRILVLMEILFCTVATALMVWGLVIGLLPALGWLYVVLVGGFALAFGVGYSKHAVG